MRDRTIPRNPDVLHPLTPWASAGMLDIWSETRRFTLERQLWLMVLDYHIETGVVVDTSGEIRRAYAKAATEPIDHDRIRQRELRTKHDLMARLQEYNHRATVHRLVDCQYAHLGMTSADVVDNIALVQMRMSVERLLELCDFESTESGTLISLLNRLPFRGIKGPIGTQQDQIDLLGSADSADDLDRYVAGQFGFKSVLGSVGQVYPRSVDLDVASAVMAAIWNREGVKRAKPSPFIVIARGYYRMIAEYSDSQWNEGDVSTSSVRRVCLPGLFLAADCIFHDKEP